MRRMALGLVAGALALTSSLGVVAAQGEFASGTFIDPQGNQVGTVNLEQTATGVKIQVSAQGLAVGEHGIHVHAVGACDPPAFTSAGGHFNPTGKKHGLQNPEGPHAGDLPNLTADSDGKTFYTTTTSRFMVADLADADGTAVVIHAGPDDQVTDPAGNSGNRVACAVLTITEAAGTDKGGDKASTPAASTDKGAAKQTTVPGAMPKTGAGGSDSNLPLAAGAVAALAGAAMASRRRR